jgi:hypothetical protein
MGWRKRHPVALNRAPKTRAERTQQSTKLNINAFLHFHKKERMYISKAAKASQGHID